MYINYAITSDGKKSPVVSSTDFINGVPASEYALKSAFVYNLLDNSDFTNPINQRGQTTYDALGYTIDRWIIQNTGSVVRIGNGGVQAGTSGTTKYLYQRLPLIEGKRYTLAACTTDNDLCVITTTYTAATSWTWLKEMTNANITLRLGIANSGKGYACAAFSNLTSSAYTKWIALYEGEYTVDTLPPYMPKGYAIEALNCGVPTHPRNLLDNSYFINPVNQRGQSSYTAANYTIDRWTLDSGAGTSGISVSNNGVTINQTTSLIVFRQSLEERVSNYLIGKKVTAAAKSSDGTIITITTTVPSSGVTLDTSEAFFPNSLGMDIYRHSTRSDLQVRFLTGETTAPITLEWVALYEGEYTAETLPPYIPKGYAVEMAECQRYFFPLNVGCLCFGSINRYGSTFYGTVYTPVTMRTTPSISTTSNNYSLTNNGTQVDLTGTLTVQRMAGNNVQVMMDVTNKGMGQAMVTKLWFTSESSSAYLSADL